MATRGRVRGCVATLGLATTDRVANSPNGLFQNGTYLDFSPWPSDRQDFSGTEFDVTDAVFRMFLPNPPGLLGLSGPDLRTASRYGCVPRGAIEELHGDDQTSCLSSVSNIKLHITYDVPARAS